MQGIFTDHASFLFCHGFIDWVVERGDFGASFESFTRPHLHHHVQFMHVVHHQHGLKWVLWVLNNGYFGPAVDIRLLFIEICQDHQLKMCSLEAVVELILADYHNPVVEGCSAQDMELNCENDWLTGTSYLIMQGDNYLGEWLLLFYVLPPHWLHC